jgi:hypothetical protein
MLNLVGHHHQEVERPLLASHPEVEHLVPRPSTARDSQSTERKSLKKNHHRRTHNNSNAICDSGSGKKNSGAAFYVL